MHDIITRVEYDLVQARNQQELDENFKRFEENEKIVKVLRKLHKLIRKSRIPKVIENNKNVEYIEEYDEKQNNLIILKIHNFEIKYVNDICQDDVWEYTITYLQDKKEVIFKHERIQKDCFYKNYIESLEISTKEKNISKVKVYLEHITLGAKIYMKENLDCSKEQIKDLCEIINKIILKLEEFMYDGIISSKI